MIPTVKVELSLANKLAGLTCDAVLYDDQGRALGYFSTHGRAHTARRNAA